MSASTTCSALPSIQLAEKIRDSLGLAIIGGELHSSNGRYYEKITSEQLETKIIDELRHSNAPINKNKVKDIANTIVAFHNMIRRKLTAISGSLMVYWTAIQNNFFCTTTIMPLSYC